MLLQAAVDGPWGNLTQAEITAALITAQDGVPRYAALRRLLAPGPHQGSLPDDDVLRRWVDSAKEEFTVLDGVLYHWWSPKRTATGLPLHSRIQLVVPTPLRKLLLAAVHDDPLTGGHIGIAKCFDKLRDRYWWEGMHHSVAQYCQACPTCGGGKGHVARAPYSNNPLPKAAFELIGIDYVGPLPWQPVLAGGDRLSDALG